jgi:hypothetical protein
MPSEEEVGRAVMAKTMSKLVPDVDPACTGDGVSGL